MNQKEIVKNLQSKIDAALISTLKNQNDLILLDFPNHANVGDSAIYLGELAFFKKNGNKKPTIVSDCHHLPVDEIESTDSNCPIFLHGGGNFGDLWPGHQQFRESVLKKFPGRLVVQLPQTIHYKSKEEITRTAKIIKDHGNFLLLVRDEVSYEIARNSFECRIDKCPDMAFYMEALQKTPSTNPLLFLLRNDREKREEAASSKTKYPAGSITTDWIDDAPDMKRNAKIRTIANGVFSATFKKMALKEDYFSTIAKNRVNRGVELLGSSEFIITDRLHAHIISLLLDIPHVVLDNSYGKVSRFIKMWTQDYEKINQAESVAAAIDIYNKK